LWLTFRSLGGRSNSIEDTEKKLQRILPRIDGPKGSYTIAYAVHKVLDLEGDSASPAPTEFIGAVNIRSIEGGLPLPTHLTLPAAGQPETLSVELSYFFLPAAWGKGYATEAIKSLFDAAERASAFWSPFSKLYVRALVNPTNPLSQRVVEKIGMTHIGNYEWTGDAVFIAGEWRERDTIQIWGRLLAVHQQP
jgi:RimJ/RimL family protein N-acetyltransferase